MSKPKRGEVWLVRFPFTDLTSTKLRPALVWAVHGEDMVILGIFSRSPTGALCKTWVRIEEGHPAFSQTGPKIAVVHESVFQRRLGSLPPDIMMQVQEALKRALFIS